MTLLLESGIFWDLGAGVGTKPCLMIDEGPISPLSLFKVEEPKGYLYMHQPPKEIVIMSTCERCLKTGSYGEFNTRRIEFHLGVTTIAWDVCADCLLELAPQMQPLARRDNAVWHEVTDLRAALKGSAPNSQQILKRLEALRKVRDDLYSRMLGIIVSWFRNKRNDRLKEEAEKPKPPEPPKEPRVEAHMTTGSEKTRRRTRKKRGE